MSNETPVLPQPESAVKQPTVQAVQGGVSWAVLVTACVLTAMLSIATNMWLMRDVGAGGTGSRQHIVFVDTQKIINAKILEISLRQVSEAEAAAEGSSFAKRLQDAVAEYHDKGITVVHGAALLSEKDENDLTIEVASRLGVNLDTQPGHREQSAK